LLDFKGLKLLLKSSAKADVQILNPLSGKDFGGIRAFWIWFFRMPECVPQGLEYFDAIWSRYENKKARKSTFYRLLSDLSDY